MLVTPELLKAFPILRLLSEESLVALSKQSTFEKHSRRSIVLSAGKQEEAVCFVFEGRLQGVDFTLDGREVGLYFVEQGGFCGELALFDEDPQPEFVISVTSSSVVMIPAKELRGILQSAPKVIEMLGTKLAAKIRQLTLQRSLLALPNIGQRVCYQLWMLVEEKQRLRAEVEGITIEIVNPPTHREIAIMLNLSRETVTRVFQALQNYQIVKRDGPSKLILAKPADLRRLAEGQDEL